MKHPVKSFMYRVTGLVSAITLAWFSAGGAFADESGKEIMENRCTLCHDLPDPSRLSGEQWVVKLETMAAYAGLNKEEKGKVLSYVTGHGKKAAMISSMAREQKLFEEKCSICHNTNRVLLIPMTPDSAAHVVKRMQERVPKLISDTDVHEILEYINHGMPGMEKPEHKQLSGGPAKVFQARCTACHTAERVYLAQKHAADKGTAMVWGHVVNRMRSKAPDWITDREAEQILDYLGTIKPAGQK